MENGLGVWFLRWLLKSHKSQQLLSDNRDEEEVLVIAKKAKERTLPSPENLTHLINNLSNEFTAMVHLHDVTNLSTLMLNSDTSGVCSAIWSDVPWNVLVALAARSDQSTEKVSNRTRGYLRMEVAARGKCEAWFWGLQHLWVRYRSCPAFHEGTACFELFIEGLRQTLPRLIEMRLKWGTLLAL